MRDRIGSVRGARGRLLDGNGSALIAAVLMLALAGATAALLAELGRVALGRARVDRDGTRAWFLAEAGLADTIAGLASGTDFTDRLAAPPPPLADPAPWSYLAEFSDDADETPDDPSVDANRQVLLRITASGPPPVRRRLEALVERQDHPFFPGAVTLSGGVMDLTGGISLDGRDSLMGTGCAMGGGRTPRAGLTLPEGASLPAVDHPERITGTGGEPSIERMAAPDLSGLGADASATRIPAGALPGTLGNIDAPQFTVVEGDAVVDATTTGAGVLYATGKLSVQGALAFTGVVAAAGGVELLSASDLTICGALWAAGEPAFDARGGGAVHWSSDAARWAAGIAPLPARARVVAVRELF